MLLCFDKDFEPIGGRQWTPNLGRFFYLVRWRNGRRYGMKTGGILKPRPSWFNTRRPCESILRKPNICWFDSSPDYIGFFPILPSQFQLANKMVWLIQLRRHKVWAMSTPDNPRRTSIVKP